MTHRNGHHPAGIQAQPAAGAALRRGVETIVAAVRPALGPTPRYVAVAPAAGGPPELLDCGATIARRIIALPEAEANAGAMLARAVIWRTQEAVGDGTATAAVIFAQALTEGVRLVAAGVDPWALRRELARLTVEITAELDAMATPVRGKTRLAHLALSVGHDPELAPLLGEILDVVGAEGQVEVRSAPGRRCDREYAEGMHWPSGVASPRFITDAAERRAALTDCGVVITDFDLTQAGDARVILAQVKAAKLGAVVILAQRFSDAAIAALIEEPLPAVAVKLPGSGETARYAAQQDLAILTGGRLLSRAAGDTAASLTPDHVGRARLAWASRDQFGIIGGKGEPRALRRHIAALRSAVESARDPDEADRLRERLGKLLGGSATLFVAGATPAETETRKAAATRAVAVLRGALREGVVPGGGTAYLACRDALDRTAVADSEATRLAIQVARAALEAPARGLIANAGHEPAAWLARLASAGPGVAFDARTGRLVDAHEAGLLDSAAVAKAAARIALTAAAQALTIDAIVTARSPATATTPAG